MYWWARCTSWAWSATRADKRMDGHVRDGILRAKSSHSWRGRQTSRTWCILRKRWTSQIYSASCEVTSPDLLDALGTLRGSWACGVSSRPGSSRSWMARWTTRLRARGSFFSGWSISQWTERQRVRLTSPAMSLSAAVKTSTLSVWISNVSCQSPCMFNVPPRVALQHRHRDQPLSLTQAPQYNERAPGVALWYRHQDQPLSLASAPWRVSRAWRSHRAPTLGHRRVPFKGAVAEGAATT